MDRRGQLLLAFAGLAAADQAGDLKTKLRETLNADPIGSVLGTVLIGSLLFFEAEKNENPKVKTFADALVFVSTSMSVGYSDIFPKTDKGKLIATALQTFGPALSAQALDAPHIASNQIDEQNLAIQSQILDKLDAILTELKERRA
ncbi:MAG TPA: potassium channel family protein [Polyangiaceae bacterium]|jgi:hypothetical protein|nr:potassium channel family protein [Polyangiaceae bacterium]